MTKCDKCGSRAVAFQKYSGAHLCKDHFDKDIHRKVRETLRESRALGHGVRVAVALDGGKHSAAMLHSLRAIFSHRSDLTFRAFFIDEGIAGYRHQIAARDLAEQLGVSFEVMSIQDAFGSTIDKVASGASPLPCPVCRAMKAALLQKASREMGADLLVTGECLDHEARAVMLNYLRGDIDDLHILRPGLKDRSSPLRRVPGNEAALYSDIHGLPSRELSCPYAGDMMDTETARALDQFEEAHPGTMYSLLKGLDLLVAIRPEREVHACHVCGMPCLEDDCKSCAILSDAACGAKGLSDDDM